MTYSYHFMYLVLHLKRKVNSTYVCGISQYVYNNKMVSNLFLPMAYGMQSMDIFTNFTNVSHQQKNERFQRIAALI